MSNIVLDVAIDTAKSVKPELRVSGKVESSLKEDCADLGIDCLCHFRRKSKRLSISGERQEHLIRLY